MPKVTMPLGSSEASGRVGKSLIFQGTTVKAYRAPKIVKVSAQTDAEDRFQSVTKVILSAGLWGRAVFEAVFGRNWLSAFYGHVCNNWGVSMGFWESMDSGDQGAWRLAAPTTETRLDQGMTYFAVANGLLYYFEEFGGYRYGFPDIFVGEVVITLDWVEPMWTNDFSGVLLAGKYDQDEPKILNVTYWSEWNLIQDSLAYGGSYRNSPAGEFLWMRVYIYGIGVSWIYKEVTASMGIQIVGNDSWADIFSLNNIEGRYQQEVRSRTLPKGLYLFDFFKVDSDDELNMDGLIVHG